MTEKSIYQEKNDQCFYRFYFLTMISTLIFILSLISPLKAVAVANRNIKIGFYW